MTLMENLSKLLILLIFSTSMLAYAEEDIYKPHEITTVLITFFWFDTIEEMHEEYVKVFGEKGLEVEDPTRGLEGFSGVEEYMPHNFCHLDMYVVRPKSVDDEHVLTIGHEVLHCVYGVDYHR